MSILEQTLFGRVRDAGSELGVYQSLAIGHARDSVIRVGGSSGGVVTALLLWLLETGAATGAITVGYSAEDPLAAVPVLCRTPEQVVQSTQSKLMLTAQNVALAEAEPGDRLVMVGLPCQVTGLRKAQVFENLFDSVILVLGLCCMSNYSPEATRFVVEEVMRVPAAEVSAMSFREGDWPGNVTVTTREGRRHSLPFLEAAGFYAMFRPYRCTVCLDWSAELSDVSFADYWIDPDKRGFSSVIIRSDAGRELLRQAEAAGRIHMEPATANAITTNMGFQYKKRGNSLFVREARRHGLPCPEIR